MQTSIKIILETTLFVKIVVIKPKMFTGYHIFFEFPCYDFERHTLFKCISDMGLDQPVTLNMLLCGDNNISYSENIALFNFIHTYISYKLRDFIDDICVPFIYYLQLSYNYHMHIIITIQTAVYCFLYFSFSSLIFSTLFFFFHIICYFDQM